MLSSQIEITARPTHQRNRPEGTGASLVIILNGSQPYLKTRVTGLTSFPIGASGFPFAAKKAWVLGFLEQVFQ
jgi:hypothetical protein